MFSTLHRRAQIAPLQDSNKTITPCVHIFVNARIPDPKRLSQIPRFQNMLKPTCRTLNPMINVENLNPQTPPSPNLTTTIIHAIYIYVPSWSLALQKLTQNSALQIPSWPTDAQCLSVYSCVTEAMPHFKLSLPLSLSLSLLSLMSTTHQHAILVHLCLYQVTFVDSNSSPEACWMGWVSDDDALSMTGWCLNPATYPTDAANCQYCCKLLWRLEPVQRSHFSIPPQ
jgi:hypothetical protein